MEESGEKEKEEILKDKQENKEASINYDVILVDEGQDFKESWFKLLRAFIELEFLLL